METSDLVLSVMMGIGLAAATGLRVFVPLLVAGVAFRFGVVPSDASSWLSSTPVLLGLALAVCLEILAYKIPLLDNFLDVLGAPLALGAGAILASEFFIPSGSPGLVTILGLIAGSGVAGVVHGSTAVARFTSTKASFGTANPLVSSIELVGALVVSIASVLFPLIVGTLAVVCVAILVRMVLKLKQQRTSR